MKVINSELDYTGGGIWCAWGILEDGTIFCGSDNENFVIFPFEILHELNEDCTIYDVDFNKAIRYTDEEGGENAQETYDIWKQVYEQHEPVEQRLWDDLYYTYCEDKRKYREVDLKLRLCDWMDLYEILCCTTGNEAAELKDNIYWLLYDYGMIEEEE